MNNLANLLEQTQADLAQAEARIAALETQLAHATLLTRIDERIIRHITDYGSDVFALINDKGEIEYVSPSIERVMGYSVDECILLGVNGLIHPDDLMQISNILHELLSVPGQQHSFVVRCKHKDGDWLWLEVTANNHLQNPEVHAILVNGRDITERKHAEEALQAIFNYSMDAILLTVPDGRILKSNPAATRMFGYSEAEFIQKGRGGIVDRSDPRVSIALEKRRITGQFSGELTLIRSDGTPFPGEISTVLFKDVHGNDFTTMIIRDITERKRAEALLLQSEAALKQAQKVAQVGSWAWHIQSNRLEWSDEMYHIFGINKEDFTGELSHVISHAIHPDDRDAVESTNSSVINDKKPIPLEYRVIWPDGTVRVVWAEAGEMILDPVGNPAILTGIVQDITKRKQVEEKLRNLNRTLAVVNQINQATIRIRSMPMLFQEVCRIAVETGGLHMVWIGLLDPETTKMVPVGSAGVIGDYLEHLDIRMNDEVRRSGPNGTAVSTGKHYIVTDIEHDPLIAPWRERALRIGYRTSAAFPLFVAGKVCGTLNLYANQSNFFDDDEIKLIDEVAANLSFAMEFAEQEAQRHQAEEGLKQHIEKLESLRVFLQTTLDAFPANTVVLDLHGNIVNLNASWLQFADGNSSHSPTYFIGSNYLTVCDAAIGANSEEAAPAAAGIRAVISGLQDSFDLEYPCHSPSEKRWFAMRVTPFPESAPRRVVIAHINITDRRLAEEAERTQRLFAEALRDSLAALTSSLDVDIVMQQLLASSATVIPCEAGTIVLFEGNRGRVAYSRGYSEEAIEYFNQTPISFESGLFVKSKSRESFYLAADTQSTPDWVSFPYTDWIRSSIGVSMLVHGKSIGMLIADSATPNRFQQEDVEKLQVFARYASLALENAFQAAQLEHKITERTAELNAAKQRVEAILNSGTDAILLVHDDFTIQQANASFNNMFGYEQDDCFGNSLMVLLSPTNEDIMAKLIQATTLQNKLIIDVEALRKDGTVFAAEISLGFITDDNFVCTFHDINARKLLEQSLLAAVQKEKELNELKTRFVSMASHEFRTPLSTIRATIETLIYYRHRLSDEQIDQKLIKATEQIDFLTDIMDDVLQLARLQARRFEYNPSKLDLDTLWQEILDEYRNRQDIHHQFHYSSDKSLPSVQADKKLMRQIITNMLSNAVKYSSPDKAISIKLERIDNKVGFTVQDGGIGIPENDLSHLFESFHRAENVGSVHGTGLGLVIIKEAVDLHGGLITVESQVNLGTKFTVQIPIAIQDNIPIEKSN